LDSLNNEKPSPDTNRAGLLFLEVKFIISRKIRWRQSSSSHFALWQSLRHRYSPDIYRGARAHDKALFIIAR
jgi:hypothetical protein